MGELRRLTYRLSPRGRAWLGWGVAFVGFGLVAWTLLRHGIVGAGGGGGIDAYAYLMAGRAAADGAPLYETAEGAFGAYAYPPLLAQLLAPVSGMPVAAFVWAWRGLELIGLRLAVGSWQRAGWAMLLPPVVVELDAGNVHLIMAGVCALAMRGIAWPILPSALLKFASFPLAPLGLVGGRRSFLLGAAAAAALAVGSYALAPERWSEWLAFLSRSTFPPSSSNLAEALPLPLRLAGAEMLGIAAIRWRRLAPPAVLLAYPVVWLDALSTLVAMAAPLGAASRAPTRESVAALRSLPARGTTT